MNEKKNRQLNIALTESEFAKLEQLAREDERPVSQYARLIITRKLKEL